MPMPTLPYRTGLKTNLTNFVNVSIGGGLAFAQRELTLFRENIEGPRNLLSVRYISHVFFLPMPTVKFKWKSKKKM